MTDNEDFDDSDESLGWEAINQALKPIYGDQEPQHYGTIIKFGIGGPDPIDGVSVYLSEKGVPHWHYVTYGFTELYSKESPNPEYSGYGFELTMRLTRNGENVPPIWPIPMLQNLARYVFSSGNIFESGHYIDCNGPIALETDTQLRALIFIEDPELKPIDTPHGKVAFLQVVGVTLEELKNVKLWNTLSFADLLAKDNPCLVTDLDRSCSLKNGDMVAKIEEAIKKEGSNTASLYVERLDYKLGMFGKCEVVFGADAISDLRALLKGRLGHGRELEIDSGDRIIRFMPADNFSFKEVEKGALAINLTPADAAELSDTVEVREGSYKFRDMTFKVLKTEMKDRHGKVVNVIG